VSIHRHLVENGPALAVTHAAEDAELLVIGSHGHRHLREIRELHLGSVASYCVHHAPCPVLVYRETGTDG
jgi:nucleotide-binding universal stress UspA family protein